jgi:tRNA-binding EMAP/Myf-like protein
VLYRKVLVAANLKPRKMAGVESNGMVFCASNDDHTIVRCLRSCALRPFARARFFFFFPAAALVLRTPVSVISPP